MALRPDLELINLRGNVEARLNVLHEGSVDALILASAGLNRLQRTMDSDLSEAQWHSIPPEDMLSGACQGIVAVVCRSTDSSLISMLEQISDKDSSIAAAAERSFLDVLDSFSPSHYHGLTETAWVGRPPLATLLERCDNTEGNGEWSFRGLLARPDGLKVLRTCQTVANELSVEDAIKLGGECAQHLLEKAGPDFYQ